MSCSSHAPRSWRPGEATRVSLSIPLGRGEAQDGSEHEARVLLGGHAGGASGEHALGLVEEMLDVEPHDRGGDHAEVRERGVAPADALQAGEDVAEAVGLGLLLQVGAGVGHGHEAAARLVGAERLLHAVEEVGLEDVGLEGRARLAGDDEERLREVDLLLDGLDLRGVGRVEHEELREAGHAAEGLLPDLGAEAGAAHAQEHGVGEAFLLHLVAQRVQGREVVELRLHDPEPADPAAPRRWPVQREASPAKSRRVPPWRVPVLELERRPRRRGPRASAWVCALMRARLASRLRRSTAFRSLVKGSTNFLSPSASRSSVTLASETPAFSRSSRTSRGLGQVLLQAGARDAVVAERGEGLGGNRVHGLGPDQLLDVEHVAVAAGSWCRCWPRARAGSGRPSPRAPPSAGAAKIAL